MTSSDDRSFGDRVADFLDSIGLEDLTDDYREQNRRGDQRLARAFDPLPDALAELPEVHEVNKVNVHRDGEDVLVPVVPVVMEDAGEPSMDVVWDLVGSILEAVHPVFEAFHVRHYDLQFAYADEGEEEVIYRRITVQPSLVERYATDAGYPLSDLRSDVHDGDDGVPPVHWQQFDAHSVGGSGSYAGGGGAAIAAACAGASAGAAASCAGGAAGAAGGAGTGGC